LERIIAALRGAILRGELEPGQQLPAEPELATQLGVSRPVLREALKALELSGYLRIRRGYRGGTFVAEAEPEEFHTIKAASISSLEVTNQHIAEVRLAIEPAAAELAAKAGPASLIDADSALRRLALAGDRPAHVVAGIADFHLGVVEASGNPVFRSVLAGLRPPIVVELNASVQDPGWREACRQALIRLLELIESGEGPAAAAEMRGELDREQRRQL
jgi:GntR family transcriptional repressor for pyruvate dehydrogenase complex